MNEQSLKQSLIAIGLLVLVDASGRHGHHQDAVLRVTTLKVR